MRFWLYAAFVGALWIAGASAGTGGVVMAALVLGFVVLVLQDKVAERQDRRIRELETELARYRPATTQDRASPSPPKPQGGDAFLERLRRDLSGQK